MDHPERLFLAVILRVRAGHERVLFRFQRVPHLDRARQEEVPKRAAGQPLRLTEEPARGGIGVGHALPFVHQQDRHRRSLQERVEEELPLVDLIALPPERVPETVVERHELSQLVVSRIPDPNTEVVLLEAADPVGYGSQRFPHGPPRPGERPGRERQPDDDSRQEHRDRRPLERGRHGGGSGGDHKAEPDHESEPSAQAESRLHAGASDVFSLSFRAERGICPRV